MRKPLWVSLAAVAAVGSCVGSEITLLGPRRLSRPEGCAVQIVPGTPTDPMTNLASVQAHCDAAVGRGACFEELRRQVCALGGDTIYGLSDSVNDQASFVTGTVALRGASASGVPAAGAGAACTPICSPGFDCQAGRCIPLCNPACAPSEICNNHRICEPAPPAVPPR